MLKVVLYIMILFVGFIVFFYYIISYKFSQTRSTISPQWPPLICYIYTGMAPTWLFYPSGICCWGSLWLYHWLPSWLCLSRSPRAQQLCRPPSTNHYSSVNLICDQCCSSILNVGTTLLIIIFSVCTAHRPTPLQYNNQFLSCTLN